MLDHPFRIMQQARPGVAVHVIDLTSFDFYIEILTEYLQQHGIRPTMLDVIQVAFLKHVLGMNTSTDKFFCFGEVLCLLRKYKGIEKSVDRMPRTAPGAMIIPAHGRATETSRSTIVTTKQMMRANISVDHPIGQT